MSSRSIMFLVSHSSAGGAQEIWANLAEGFAARGHDVVLAALYPDRPTVRQTAAHLPWTYVVPTRPKTPTAAIGLVRSLVKRIRQDRPDLIFTAMPAANVLAAVAARLAGTGTRVVTSHHSPVETHNPAINALDSVAGTLASVKAVVSVSEVVAGSLHGKPRVYRDRRRTIHNALPPRIEALIEDLAAAHRPRVARSRTVVATGRLAAQKNYPQLLRTAALTPDVRYRIVGNGPDEAALKTLAAELGVAGRVEFLGHRSREETMAILADGDVFLQLSLFEGHSLALVEAAKLGLPLVVSDVPVQIEGITLPDGTRAGLTAAIDDPEGAAAAIRTLLDDPIAYAGWAALAARLGAAATYETMLDAYEALAA